MNHKHINKFGKIIIDGMMLTLLWAIIALPISSFSLVRLETSEDNDVLSAEDQRLIEDIQGEYEESENKSFRPKPGTDGTEETTPYLD